MLKKSMVSCFCSVLVFLGSAALSFAEEVATAGTVSGDGMKYFIAVAIAAGFSIAIAAMATGIAQGIATRSAVEGIARNPQASQRIQVALLIGLAMIESLCIYVLVISLILLFANPFVKYIVG